MKKFIIIFGISLILSSCEKVIDFELKDNPSQWVVEGLLTNINGEAEIKLSKSGDYYNPGDPEKVEGANVSIQCDDGTEKRLDEITEGVYHGNGINCEPGDFASLNVVVEGQVIEGRSQMQQAVPIDSVFYTYSPETLFAPEGYRISVVFTDPPETGNHFRIRLFIDGEPATDGIYYLFDDKDSNGVKVSYILFRNAAQANQSFRAELWAIDQQTYTYYSGLENISTVNPGPSLAAPANPENNLSNNALGYFAAIAISSSETQTIISK